jgi:class 3 adenylate cyclase/tetratricopeptide (TPR) repeat protein
MQSIAHWLNTLGLGQYAQRFADHDIDASILRDLTDQDLEKIGVSLGHRKRILRAIAELRAGSGPERGPRNEAERRQLTVMFADLVGSTALATKLDPEDLRKIVGTYQRCCAEVIAKPGGFVARYLGDGVLAYFGYPQAHEDDAERAVRAGLALVAAVAKLDAGPAPALRVRVGIATGLVVVGDLRGEGAAPEHEVVGQTPNLAARLQALAEPDTVVIAGSTRCLLGELFECRALGGKPLKGFDHPVPVWHVVGPSAVDSRFEALRATRTPLVGRDHEIHLLMRRWPQAKRGDGSVVLITGEPGIGKSRLVQTVLERVSGEPHRPLRLFCSPHHQDSALYPVITQIERAAGLRRDEPDQQKLSKLEAVLAEATSDLTEAAPMVADLLSVPTGNRYPRLNLAPQSRKEKTLRALLKQVEGLAARRPVLMVFEDIHWIDATSLELLDTIVDLVPTLALFLLITFRPEFAPPWIGRPHVTLLSLGRLPLRQSAEMIARVTGRKALAPEIVREIANRSDGVPLFIEELTKAVLEGGVFSESDGGHKVAPPTAPLAIPTTLQASLLARLDRLARAREVAQIAAALGRQFSHELLSAVAPMPHEQLNNALAELVRAELIFRRGIPPNAEYTFKHALVQDTAYGTLLRDRRQQLHAQIAAALETQFADIVTAQPHLLAHHCAQAGLNAKAIGYWLSAGQRAVAHSAMTEAVAQLQKGLDLLASVPEGIWRRQQELDLRRALGPALAATRGYADLSVGENIARARKVAEQLDRSDCVVPLLYGQYTFHLVRAEHKLALSHAERIEQIGELEDNTFLRLIGQCWRGHSRHFLGDFVVARPLLEQCDRLNDPAHRAVYSVFGAEDPYTQMRATLGVTLIYLGSIDQGRVRVNEALAEVRQLGHAHALALVLTWACWAECIGGSPQEALRRADEMANLSSEHGFPFWSAWALLFRGRVLSGLGQAREALPCLTRGLSMLRTTGGALHTPLALVFLAEAHAGLGQVDEGLKSLSEAAQLIEATDERVVEAELYRMRGDLLNATGDRAATEQSYQQALVVARRQSAKLFELRAATSLARLWRDRDRRTEALDLLTPIYGWFTEGLDTPVLKKAKALLDQMA